jgi:transposase
MSKEVKVKIDSLNDLSYFSPMYLRGELKVNITRIAKELQCDRKTVRNYLKGQFPSTTRKKKKYLDDYKERILNYLTNDTQQFEYIDHLYNYMVREHGITCSRSTFNRYIRSNHDLNNAFKKNHSNSITVRFETDKGQQAQFDLKEKVKLITDSGEVTTIYIPTITLSWSRFNYRKLILDNTTDNLLEFLAEAFEHLGGAPKELVIDNLKQFIIKPRTSSGDQAILNTKFEEFCKDYGIIVKPCMSRRPQTKGKTETQNKIVDQLKNYNGMYKGILDMHEKLSIINKEDNEKISQATRLPRLFLLTKEKGDLLPLPTKEVRSKYHLSIKEVNVSNESLIQYKYNKYSLPKEFIGKKVGLVIQKNKLHIYYNGKIIETHEISGKALNIKEQHQLYYPFKEITNHKNHNSMILNELGDIAYDND